jgi:TolB protein
MGTIRKLLLAGLLLALPPMAAAQLTIEISRGVSEAVPVAVVPFAWEGEGEAPLDVAGVIENDLERSGRFAALDRADMIGKPSAPADVNFRDWRLLNTDVLVTGSLRPAPEGYEMTFFALDVFRGEQLIGYSLKAPPNGVRAAAHRAADMIFEKLTGVPGAFSTRIAYVSVEGERETERFRLIVADADGENPVVVADSREPLMSPAWSPDANRLAYVSFEGGSSGIYVQELATGRRQLVSSHPGINGAPAWSPDGQRLAMTLSMGESNLDIYVLNPATNDLRRLTRNPAIDTEASWSPDGETIYFTSDRAGGPQIYAVPVAGGSPRRVTFEGSYNARPRVSPDERSMAVVHNDRGNFRIALVDIQRRSVRVLSDGRQDESPSFAPNGSMIIYATRAGRRGVLAAVSTDGRVQQRIAATAGDVREPVWSPYPAR